MSLSIKGASTVSVRMHEANELAADEFFYFKSQAELYVENMAHILNF